MKKKIQFNRICSIVTFTTIIFFIFIFSQISFAKDKKTDLFLQNLVNNWSKLSGKNKIIQKQDSSKEAEIFQKLSSLGIDSDNDKKITKSEVIEAVKTAVNEKKSPKGLKDSKKSKAIYREYIIKRSLANLNHPSSLERYVASSYLVKYYKKGNDQKIIDFLRDRVDSNQDTPACYNLIRLFGKIKTSNKDAINLLKKIIGVSAFNKELRIAAIESLGKTGDLKLLPILEKQMVIEQNFHNNNIFLTLLIVSGKLRGKQYTKSEVHNLKIKFKQQWSRKNRK